MLSKLLIKNFQAHEKVELELDPITVIVGPSDTGKSSILRSLQWICTNKPSGEAFVRYGSQFAAVSLWADGYKIKRYKGPKGNLYQLDDKEYRAFGNDVPPEIANLLNLGNVNFQTQHDAPYWLSLTAGQVSKELNEIVDLGIIDEVLDLAASETKRAKAEVAVGEKRLLEAQARKTELEWVDQLNQDLQQAEETEEQAQTAVLQASRLQSLLEEGSRVGKQIQSIYGLSHAIQDGVKELELVAELDEETNKLKSSIGLYTKQDGELCQIQLQLSQVEENLRKVQVCPVCNRPMKTKS